MRNKPQPKRNPTDGPSASRRNTYCPPARGHIAASSAQQRAPVIVSTPASAQATSSQPGDPTSREDSADVMKIPDPIIEPTTIVVASSRLRPRRRFEGASLLIRASGYSAIVRRLSVAENLTALHYPTGSLIFSIWSFPQNEKRLNQINYR